MTVLVNYYTCSYGDSLVNMFNGNPVARTHNVTRCNFKGFIEPNFYIKDINDQQVIWSAAKALNLTSLPCHRQNGFDFSHTFDNTIKVITIVLDQINFLPHRFKKIHLDERKKNIKNSMLSKLLERHPAQWKEVIIRDYKIWLEHNLLPTDLSFNISWIQDSEKIYKFCKQHNLLFDQNWIMDIQKDLGQYALL